MTCSECQDKLRLPSIHFLCGHSYHDGCCYINQNDEKECMKCFDDDNPVPKDTLDKKE